MFMYYYCYVCTVLGILFHCVVLCIVFVQMCTVLLPPAVNPIAVIKCIISYHKTLSQCRTLFTANLTWTDLGWNLGLRAQE